MIAPVASATSLAGPRLEAVPTTPTLPLTGDPEADRLLGDDPLALLIGMLLDQRINR